MSDHTMMVPLWFAVFLTVLLERLEDGESLEEAIKRMLEARKQLLTQLGEDAA